ncbi:MAG: helix-turn-helix transcriptional regulator [Betaproteobacteria bacterium]|nr:helix-turn-helix transcriptional regulator [Betaproteobacteria bacterium]
MSGAAPAPVESLIGARIAERRAELGITLERLAAATGFSKGYLSKIENSRKVPPIGSLSRIAAALRTDITQLLHTPAEAGEGGGLSVVRAGERRPVVRGGTAFGYDYVSLADNRRDKKMEPFLFTFPSQIDKYVFFEHDGEEFMFVLSGRVEWQAGSRRLVLEPGDSIYFDARLPHRGRALDGEATAVVVTCSPKPAE